MFTGLIEAIGSIRSISRGGGGDLSLTIEAPFDDVRLGDSISVSGVCLTATEVTGHMLKFFVSSETLSRSKLASSKPGTCVNLERAIQAGDRLGGHIVQGHVDEIGEVISLESKVPEWLLSIRHSEDSDPLIVEKGSVAVDGISLTVASCTDGVFSAAVIPHTYKETTLKDLKTGAQVNLEFDVVAKYIIKGLQSYLPDGDRTRPKGKLSVAFLGKHGFL
ncbi:MAG: riboflavin synthase [Candidatus Coatesbacteria bacterium]|nr:riboflavin synthase [Candidatus Coatesbacteria bacterium]